MDAMEPGFYSEEHMPTVTLSNVTRTPLTEELDRTFREHYPLVYRTALGVTGSPEDAQDIAQTVFLRLLRRESPPDLKKHPKAYLYRAAVNLSLNTIRSRRSHIRADGAEALEKAAPSSAESDSAEDLHQRLYAAIAELDAEAGQILVLRYVHGYSIAEIAGLLGKSNSLIAVRLFRSRARLKKLIRAPRKGDDQ
jgi:RNA polymerase sigma-70 factor (ECF subfamily)